MDRVQPVVHGEPVEQTARERASGVRERLAHRARVTPVMLQNVHRDDAPLRHEVWNPHVEEEPPRVAVQGKSLREDEHCELSHYLLGEAVSERYLQADEADVGHRHRPSHRWLKHDEIQEVPPVLDLRSPHDVAPPLGELMVRQVMPRHVRRHGVSVRERKGNLKQLVCPVLLKHLNSAQQSRTVSANTLRDCITQPLTC